jgi:hypothetical protein
MWGEGIQAGLQNMNHTAREIFFLGFLTWLGSEEKMSLLLF